MTDPARRLIARALPGVVVLAFFVGRLHASGIGLGTIAWFLLIQLVVYVVPGTLGWRVLRGGRDPRIVNLVLGTIAMHALMVPWYIAVRWIGVPRAVWVLPVLVVVVAVLGARRTGLALLGGERLPVAVAWHGALAVSLGILQVGAGIPRATGPERRWPGTDNPFLLSIAGELKHHVPPVTPFVTGESLDYHWFTFADVAATSWAGGQELDLLLFALVPLAVFTTAVAAFGLLGWRFTGRVAGGVITLWLAVLVGSVNALGNFPGFGYVLDSTFLNVNWVLSITQGFAQMICVAVLFVTVELLRRPRPGAATWILFVLLTFVVAGAKATFTPVLGAGALLALIAAVVLRRGGWRRPLALGLILAAELVFAQVVLFGGVSQGLALEPVTGVHHVIDYMDVVDQHGAGLTVVLAFVVLGWLLPLIGSAVFLLPGERHRALADPAAAWLLGMLLSGVAAAVLIHHPGFSNYFFLRAGLPFAYLAVAAAVLRVADLLGDRAAGTAALGAGLGFVTCLLLRAATTSRDLPRPIQDVTLAVLGTVAVVVIAAVAAAVLAADRGRALAAVVLAGSLALGMGATRVLEVVGPDQPDSLGVAPIPRGGIVAARYVRAHSDPDELFATNAHCRLPGYAVCWTVAHWMSAWTERRAVVEGWGYTARANKDGTTMADQVNGPFWDQPLLELNDRVFLHPDATAVQALVDRFDVRWLIVDRRFPADLAGMRAVLPVHRKVGEVTLFDVRASLRAAR